MLNIKILICCHKNDIWVKKDPYMPIQVGKDLSSIDMEIVGDNTGDNISRKNANYCELTGIYWAWKNLKNVDIVGLCHYRRYFDFHHQCRFAFPFDYFRDKIFESVNFSIPDKVLKINDNSVIVPKAWKFGMPLGTYYCVKHSSMDLKRLESIMEKNCTPNYMESFSYIMYGNNKLIPFNMFIMSWDRFNHYCSWLFKILSQFEKEIDIKNYDDYQKRIFGFLAERLFNVYLHAEKIKCYHYPIILITNNPREGRLEHIVSSLLKDVSFFFQKVLYYWGAKVVR